MSTWVELYHLFRISQKARLDDAQWIQTAWERCVEVKDSFGWNWSKSGNSPTYSVNLPKSVNCRYIESIVDSDELDNSKALVLYPTLSTYAQGHPDFILPSDNEIFYKNTDISTKHGHYLHLNDT